MNHRPFSSHVARGAKRTIGGDADVVFLRNLDELLLWKIQLDLDLKAIRRTYFRNLRVVRRDFSDLDSPLDLLAVEVGDADGSRQLLLVNAFELLDGTRILQHHQPSRCPRR